MPIKSSLSTLFLALFLLQAVQQTLAYPDPLSSETMDNLLSNIDSIMFPKGRGQLRAAKHIRAQAHDCTKGCDGRIHLANNHHRGLERFVQLMDNVYYNTSLPFVSTLSRADFWVLCGRRALAWAIKEGDNNTGTIPKLAQTYSVYNYGRPNDPSASDQDNQEGPFVDALANWTSSDPLDPNTILGSTRLAYNDKISEYDLVALLGLHNMGAAVQNNSGFAGAWGNCARNTLTSDMYSFLMGAGRGRNFKLVQTPSELHVSGGAALEQFYVSDPPVNNKLQWTKEGATDRGRIMLNVDMGIYHNFKSDQHGAVSSKWCPQMRNESLYDCHQTDPSYMPLSANAQQAWDYHKNQTKFFEEVIDAFIRMTSVKPSGDTSVYLNFTPELKCVNGQLVCQGDVFMQGCPDFTPTVPCQ